MVRPNDTDEAAARAALRVRQGRRALYDAPLAPTHDLLLARRGTACFARKLNELSDAELDGSSLCGGWTRRHVVSHVAYHARSLAQLIEQVTAGQVHALAPSSAARQAEIELGATLPAEALRNLFRYKEVQLNVRWRDLSCDGLDAIGTTIDGAEIAIRDTLLLRAQEVWHGALRLNLEHWRLLGRTTVGTASASRLNRDALNQHLQPFTKEQPNSILNPISIVRRPFSTKLVSRAARNAPL